MAAGAGVEPVGGVRGNIMSLAGYVNGATAIYRLFAYTPAAAYMAVVLFMLSAAIFFAASQGGNRGRSDGEIPGERDGAPLSARR